MGKYFEKMLYWDEFLECFKERKIYYIGNESSEQRADNKPIVSALSKLCQCTDMQLKYDYDTDSFIYAGKRFSLKFEARKILENLDKDIPIILNITSLNLRLLGTLLFNIKKLCFNKVYCIYTEPLRYCKGQEESDEQEYSDRFDLYKRFRGIEAIPGFIRGNDDNLNERWIVFLGFEGKRLEQISEKYDFENIVPVITLPSYQPGWYKYAFDENLDFIKRADRKPEYIIANSVMSAYNYLEKTISASQDSYIRISPLGTKVNALGALLFSLNHTRNIEILYDNPSDEGKVSEACGRAYVFDISEIINDIRK